MEEIKAQILAYHGWGFIGDFWSTWQNLLPSHIELKAADRGYFGSPKDHQYSGNMGLKVIFVHSFGFHWCPDENLKEADVVVVFNSFNSFHPHQELHRSSSEKILTGMEHSFRSDPEAVLLQFYNNCTESESEVQLPDGKMDLDLLQKDLHALHHTSPRKTGREDQQWIILDADNDRIVPGQRGLEIAAFFDVRTYHLIKNANHGMPLLKTGECYEILSEELPIFRA